MRLTPFSPGTLRISGKGFFSNSCLWRHQDGSIRNEWAGWDKPATRVDLPLPRWKEIVWWWLVRPVRRARYAIRCLTS